MGDGRVRFVVNADVSGGTYRNLGVLMRVVALTMVFETRWLYPEGACAHLRKLLQAKDAEPGSFLVVPVDGEDVHGSPRNGGQPIGNRKRCHKITTWDREVDLHRASQRHFAVEPGRQQVMHDAW